MIINLLVLLSFILSCLLIYTVYNNKKIIKKNKINLNLKNKRENLEKACDDIINRIDSLTTDYKNEELRLIERKKFNEELIEQLNKNKENEINSKNEFIDLSLSHFFDNDYREFKEALTLDLESLKLEAQSTYLETTNALKEDLLILQNELALVHSEIDDWRKKRDSINQDILRARAINEQQEFYRVSLSEDSIDDIKVLLIAREKLHFRQNLDKLIYDGYVSKPAREMTKRVLNNKTCSGIYKITNISTKEIYIGKSTNVTDRWINHIKSAYGLEGVADSTFQRALKKYGVENFTWELIEETSKEQLTEREKYYITLYDTITYGYNQRLG